VCKLFVGCVHFSSSCSLVVEAPGLYHCRQSEDRHSPLPAECLAIIAPGAGDVYNSLQAGGVIQPARPLTHEGVTYNGCPTAIQLYIRMMHCNGVHIIVACVCSSAA
jgi:hypothetical protein